MAVGSRVWGAAAQAASLALSLATMPQAHGSEVLALSGKSGDLWAQVGIGTLSVPCIVDTGASVTQIDGTVLVASGAVFKPERLARFTTASGAETFMPVGMVTLRLGGTSVRARVAMRDALNGPAPCLLGQSALSRFPSVLMDFRRNRLVLETEE